MLLLHLTTISDVQHSSFATPLLKPSRPSCFFDSDPLQRICHHSSRLPVQIAAARRDFHSHVVSPLLSFLACTLSAGVHVPMLIRQL